MYQQRALCVLAFGFISASVHTSGFLDPYLVSIRRECSLGGRQLWLDRRYDGAHTALRLRLGSGSVTRRVTKISHVALEVVRKVLENRMERGRIVVGSRGDLLGHLRSSGAVRD